MKHLQHSLAFVLTFVVLMCASSAIQAQKHDSSSVTGKAFKFDKIADGVYYATATGNMVTGGNNTVIVNDHDVLLVDADTTPAAARELLKEIKSITNKPVRWVVNTHFHFDHTDGNSVFGPEVEIIGHEYVRDAILHRDVLHTEPFKTSVGDIPHQIDGLEKQAAEEKDAEKRAALSQQIAAMKAELTQIKEVKPTPPTMTYASKLTLYRGDREIQLLFLGRGHTPGDTVVFLPKERIVCTGDLMESRLAYMGDGVFDEWITSLEALKKLDFDTVLPGHGVPFHDKGLITAYQDYLRDLVGKVAALRKQGVSAEEAAQKVDMTSHQKDFPQIQGPGADLRGVRRMYQWLAETGK